MVGACHEDAGLMPHQEGVMRSPTSYSKTGLRRTLISWCDFVTFEAFLFVHCCQEIEWTIKSQSVTIPMICRGEFSQRSWDPSPIYLLLHTSQRSSSVAHVTPNSWILNHCWVWKIEVNKHWRWLFEKGWLLFRNSKTEWTKAMDCCLGV